MDLQANRDSTNLYAKAGLERAILLIIILLATLLRFWLIGENSLDGDEINIINRALGLADISLSGNGIIYTPILQLFVAFFGTTDVVFRLPGLFVGIVTIPITYKTGQLLFNPSVGLAAAFLLAISIIHLNYSQETHSYTLFTFLSLLSFYCFWQAIHKNRPYYWLGLSLALSLNILAHLFAVFVLVNVIAIYVFMFIYYRFKTPSSRSFNTKETTLKFALSIIPALLVSLYLFISYLLQSAPQFMRVATSGNLLEAQGVGDDFVITMPLFIQAFENLIIWRFPYHSSIHLLYMGGFFLGAVYLAFKDRLKLPVFLIWLLLPLLPIALASRLAGVDYHPRRLIFILPIYLVVVALGLTIVGQWLSQLSERSLKLKIPISVTTLVLALGLYGWATIDLLHWYYYEFERKDWKRTAQLLNSLVLSGDVVITHANEEDVVNSSHLNYYYVPSGDRLIIQAKTDLQIEDLEQLQQDHQRVWYVRKVLKTGNFLDIEDWLSEQDFLTFPMGGDVFVSFKDKAISSEEARLAQWLSILQHAAQIKPDKWYILEAITNVHLRQGNYETAIRLWNNFLANYPYETAAYLALAKAYEANGQPEEAFSQIEKVIHMAPADMRLYLALNDTYKARGASEQVLMELFQRIEAIDPSVAHFALAVYYANQSQHESAIKEFHRVIQLDAGHEVAIEAKYWLSLYQ